MFETVQNALPSAWAALANGKACVATLGSLFHGVSVSLLLDSESERSSASCLCQQDVNVPVAGCLPVGTFLMLRE